MNGFALVNAVAQRAKQLTHGAPPTVTNADPDKPVATALRELRAGSVLIKQNDSQGESEER